jgi:signal transduction histidine kinase
VIEDDADLRDALAELLTARGHEVATASDGRQGLDVMRRVRPDVVVLDLMLPVMDGWSFRLEQKRDPRLAETPVVALSASDSSAAAAVDADCYLRKPVDAGRLERALEDVLNARERQRAPLRQAQTERLAALGTLAAGVAHEINNPLTYVLINLERAQRELAARAGEPGIEDVRTMLADALEGVERIRGVTHSIREFSTVDDAAGAPIDVGEVVESVLRLVASDLAQRARLEKDLRRTPEVIATRARLGQVVLNLLLNAIQALPADRDASQNLVRVETRLAGDQVVIEVRDNGAGIPDGLHGRIFEPFFSTKPMGGGAGLGLSICHGIVRSLGGAITFESRAGSGTTFQVALPAAPARPREARGAPAPSPRRRVLVVDDEPVLLSALGRTLGERHDVVRSRGGRDALDRLRSDAGYDAIVCDLHMPDVSGREFHAAVRALEPTLADRIIFMTGGVFTDAMREFLAGVSNPVLDKPIDLIRLDELLAVRSR